MTALPPSTDLTNSATDEGAAKAWFSSVRSYLSGLLGSDGTPATARAALGITSGIPAGVITQFAGATAPADWLFCYGQAVSRTTYADLYTAIGTTYGAGDGSTTFNLPDARGRVLAGKDNMGGTTAGRLTSAGSGITGTTLGASGGTQTHTLTEAQLASHAHSLPVVNNISQPNYSAWTGPALSSANVPISSPTSSAGSNQAHQNTQPTLISNIIIKT